jgi:hypothetical protein
MSTNYWKAWAYGVVLAGVALAAACGSSPKVGPCPQGAEDCACYGNNTCNSGLTCFSNLCVNPMTGNGGHGGAMGAAGATGAAGNSGGAGSSGAAGTTASGTAGTSGSAGTSGGGATTGAGGTSTTPTNLIKNGDFSLGKEYWNLTYQAGEVAADNQGMGGQYCIMNASTSFYLSFSLGYPPTPSDSFTIAAGSTYTLTYQAAVDSPATVEVKIGGVETPYTPLAGADFNDSVSSSNFTTFTHQISAATDTPTQGLVFNATLYYSATICFDNVSLVKN